MPAGTLAPDLPPAQGLILPGMLCPAPHAHRAPGAPGEEAELQLHRGSTKRSTNRVPTIILKGLNHFRLLACHLSWTV